MRGWLLLVIRMKKIPEPLLILGAALAGLVITSARPASMRYGRAGPPSSSHQPTDLAPPPLRTVADVPLPGPAARFDYQSLDPTTGRLYISHMNAGHLIVFDTRAGGARADLPGFPRATGVRAVPAEHRVFVSAAGAHALVAVDDRSLHVIARVEGIAFPDGIAYDPAHRRLYVSDESGGADVVVDARLIARIATIPLGGEAGNTHYDPVTGRVLVAVQTLNQLVTIDPATNRIVARTAMPCHGPHGFVIDPPRREAFVSCEDDATLLVVDLRTMRTVARFTVGDGPDVLALDPALHRLYVASESGVVSVFDERGGTLVPLGAIRAPHAHTVAVDPATHRVYLPLQDVGGHPVLRILEPVTR